LKNQSSPKLGQTSASAQPPAETINNRPLIGVCHACGRPVHEIGVAGYTAWIHDNASDFQRCGKAGIPASELAPETSKPNPAETSNPNNLTTPSSLQKELAAHTARTLDALHGDPFYGDW
jgi:hypothetical protein